MSRSLWVDRFFLAITALVLAAANCFAIEGTIRVATFNTSLYRNAAGQLVRDLESGNNQQARRIAEVVQIVRPDVVLLNEFDHDPDGKASHLLLTKYFAVGQNGNKPIEYHHVLSGPVNTGKPSGRDLDKNGRTGDPADAIGFGRHEGQYGMLVLSRFPIRHDEGRGFQKFLWRDMPNALLPTDPESGRAFFDAEDLSVQRLSSKSFWDVPIDVPSRGGSPPFVLHLLCSHPTPPVFDGPEDRNGKRNHDEIRLVADYVDSVKGSYLVDDSGKRGALPTDALFVIAGDLNCDPHDGEGVRGAMDLLLKHPRVNATLTPASEGGPLMVKKHAGQHAGHRGNPDHVTSNFTADGHGCLRVDYVLPSKGLAIVDSGVFWPAPGKPGSEAIEATDHRLVWIDLRPE